MDWFDLYNSNDKFYCVCSNLFYRFRKESDQNFSICEDIRSATYYALGISKSQNRKVIIFCCAEDLYDMIPAITEAWYQNISLSIISYGEAEENKRISECYETITNDINILNDEDNSSIDKCISSNGISLTMLNINHVDRSIINLDSLKDSLKPLSNSGNWRILCDDMYEVRVQGVEKINHYSFSLYEIIGRAYISKFKICVIANKFKLISGLNAINSRYIRDNLLIISVGSKIDEYQDWLEENGFSIYNSLESAKAFPAIVCLEDPNV